MHPYVYVWSTAPVPNKGRPFKTPVIQNTISTKVIALIKGEVAPVKAAIFPERGNSLILIPLTERFK